MSGTTRSTHAKAGIPYPLSSPMPQSWIKVVDSLVVPASVHDVDGRFLHMNAAAERASGRSSAQTVGHHYTDLIPLDARARVDAQFQRAVLGGEPTDFETVFTDATGHVRGVRAQHLPLREGEAIVGVLILAFDVPRPATELIRATPEPRLTPRQHEVLSLLASGLSTAAIAEDLTLSCETVRNHLRNAFRELGAHNRPEAIATAQRLGLLAAPPLGPQALDVRSGTEATRIGAGQS